MRVGLRLRAARSGAAPMEPLPARGGGHDDARTFNVLGEANMKIMLSRIAAAAVLVAAAGAASAQDAGKPGDYRLGPGDSIKVQVYQSPDLTVEARVSES